MATDVRLPMPIAARLPKALLWAALVTCIYLSTLAFPFDFNDDGCQVYPAFGLSAGEQWQRVWQRTIGDYHSRGPFRPLTWAYIEMTANWLGPNPLGHRAVRFGWAMLSAVLFAWLLTELKIRPSAIALTLALAMWNPYRNELWMALAPTEAIAMPFAVCGLICAVRAGKATRAWPWDLAGAIAVLAALACKNTFAAVVPAQLLLRLGSSDESLGAALRRQGMRCCLLAMPLLLPIGHFIHFKLNPHADAYATQVTAAQLGRMARAVLGAVSIDVMAPGLLLAMVAILAVRPRVDFAGHRRALVGGLVLLSCGIGVYLPINAVSGRYTIPAAWGLDICVAVMLSMLVALPKSRLRRVAFAVLGCGLVAVMAMNLAKQSKLGARSELLWQVVAFMENELPPGTRVIWSGVSLPTGREPELSLCEGQHFLWHVQNRGRCKFDVRLHDQTISSHLSCGSDGSSTAALVLTGTKQAPDQRGWLVVREFCATYWAGQRSFRSYLWRDELRGLTASGSPITPSPPPTSRSALAP